MRGDFPIFSMSSSFVHLHVHTEFSLLDGMVRTDRLAKRAVELGMSAVAMTDHGNLYGAIQFYKDCKKQGVKAIFGCEMYLSPVGMDQKREIVGRKSSTHITLLAETNEGWDNLIKLVSKAHLEGGYLGVPRMDMAALREFSKGLICLTGCFNSPLSEWLEQGDEEKAREALRDLVGIYGRDHTFVELMHFHADGHDGRVVQLKSLAREFDLKVVATNDVHFLHKKDHEAHDVMICIGSGNQQIDSNRTHYSPEVYFKTAEEMRALFADTPEACDATLEIAERCQVSFNLDPSSSEKYPQFGTPDGSPREEYFMKVCREGVVKRYGEARADEAEVAERLKYEVDTINQLGFASYFLITADFIQWARDNDIPVGPGRGSAAGSLVAYAMGITNICPLRFGLLFERFLNPERVSPPDVDIDFCQSRRSEVIEYVRQKYGDRCVSHIITYGKMGAKSVLRDVARVMGMSYGDADRIAKLIESKPDATLQKEWDAKAEIRELIEASSSYKELWERALTLEGLKRNVGVHAAGIVIGDRDLSDHAPLTIDGEGVVVTQYDMKAITEVALLKMDFLGLKNLTVIHEAVAHIRKTQPGFEIEDVPLDDQVTFDLLNRGDTMGVFQLESGGMVETCRKYSIDKIEDIIDLLAVYRPGAMEFIDQMLDVKKGCKKAVYEHPLLQTVAGSTYGVMIYQEQVQNAAKLLAGYTLGGADLLRRAMGKKDPVEMAKQRAVFTEGCAKTNGIGPALAGQIFDKIEKFAGYGFNKSHSACYGHISYWTAYLKANHPAEFMSALLSNEIKNTDKIGVFIAECQRMGIEILPPNVNLSWLRFTPEPIPSGGLAIRFGLSGIKNCGEGAMEVVVLDRQEKGAFESIEEFSNRLDSKVVNKRILENLIKAGAFDWTQETRLSLFSRLEEIVASAQATHRDRNAGQVSMFDMMDFAAESQKPNASQSSHEEWPKEQRLTDEKELLGYYLSGHPLDKYRHLLESDSYQRLGLLEELDLSDKRKRFPFAGMIRSIESKMAKNGKPFGVLVLEDYSGISEIMLWGETFSPAKESGLLEAGLCVKLKCAVQKDDISERFRLNGYEVKALQPAKKTARKAVETLELLLWTTRHTAQDLDSILEIVQKYPGETPLLIHVQNSAGRRATIEAAASLSVTISDSLEKALRPWLSEE